MSLMRKAGSGARFGSGSESGSVSQWYGSADPNPDQNVTNPQRWQKYIFFLILVHCLHLAPDRDSSTGINFRYTYWGELLKRHSFICPLNWKHFRHFISVSQMWNTKSLFTKVSYSVSCWSIVVVLDSLNPDLDTGSNPGPRFSWQKPKKTC
jgi:hypothetical protein